MMIKMWDPLLRTFVSSSPREITDIPEYALKTAGFYRIKIQVKKDGTVANASLQLDDQRQATAEEIVRHTLYCPAKDGQDYLESDYSIGIIACAF
jgi:hypothetical protein